MTQYQVFVDKLDGECVGAYPWGFRGQPYVTKLSNQKLSFVWKCHIVSDLSLPKNWTSFMNEP